MEHVAKPLPVIQPRGKRCYDQQTLLNDGSIAWAVGDQAALLAQAKEEPAVTRLQHPEVRYEVTDRCNAACIMCPRDLHKHGRPHGIMDLGCYKRSLDEVAALGAKQIVLIGFGEPLIDRTLEDKIAYAKRKGLRTYIISNISLLTKERSKRLIEAGLDELRASFLGMRTETYNRVMVHLDFQTSLDNLLTLLELRQAMGVRTPKLQVSYLVLPENEEDTQTFRDFWEPRADAIEIWKPHNFGDGRSYRERTEELTLKKTCGRPENGPLQIQWNGEIIPCCYDYNNQIVLGNAFEQPVLEILNNTKYRVLRIAHRRGEFKLVPYCDQCDQLLPHADALVYTNRHTLPPEEAVKLSNTDLYNLAEGRAIDPRSLSPTYGQGFGAADERR